MLVTSPLLGYFSLVGLCAGHIRLTLMLYIIVYSLLHNVQLTPSPTYHSMGARCCCIYLAESARASNLSSPGLPYFSPHVPVTFRLTFILYIIV